MSQGRPAVRGGQGKTRSDSCPEPAAAQSPSAAAPPRGAYRLLDTGGRARLEEVGPFRLERPAPVAFWPRGLTAADWDQVAARYHRASDGGGQWEQLVPLPESWVLEFGGLVWEIRPTGFGHLGLFPEQAEGWRWLADRLKSMGQERNPSVLNLFAYTGGSTLVCARAGARVCHLDAAQGAVAWARRNAALSGLAQAPVRWVVDDVVKFVRREQRRGSRHNGLILDPPSFGRGAKGEVWKIEDDLPALLEGCRALLAPGPAFLLLSCHSPGFTPRVLLNLLRACWSGAGGQFDAGEMVVEAGPGGTDLPSGTYSRWWRDA